MQIQNTQNQFFIRTFKNFIHLKKLNDNHFLQLPFSDQYKPNSPHKITKLRSHRQHIFTRYFDQGPHKNNSESSKNLPYVKCVKKINFSDSINKFRIKTQFNMVTKKNRPMMNHNLTKGKQEKFKNFSIDNIEIKDICPSIQKQINLVSNKLIDHNTKDKCIFKKKKKEKMIFTANKNQPAEIPILELKVTHKRLLFNPYYKKYESLEQISKGKSQLFKKQLIVNSIKKIDSSTINEEESIIPWSYELQDNSLEQIQVIPF